MGWSLFYLYSRALRSFQELGLLSSLPDCRGLTPVHCHFPLTPILLRSPSGHLHLCQTLLLLSSGILLKSLSLSRAPFCPIVPTILFSLFVRTRLNQVPHQEFFILSPSLHYSFFSGSAEKLKYKINVLYCG